VAYACVGKCGFIDKTGKWFMRPRFGGINNFEGGLAWVDIRESNSLFWVYINKSGHIVWQGYDPDRRY